MFKLIKLSQPKHWHYWWGSYLLGMVVAIPFWQIAPLWPVVATFLYFIFPASLWLHGLESLAHKQKLSKSERITLLRWMLWTNLIWLSVLIVSVNWLSLVIACLFLILSGFYYFPPVQAEKRPILDLCFGCYALLPAWLGYLVSGGTHFAWEIALAAICWCVALQAFHKTLHIEFNINAKIQNTGTWLGRTKTLWLALGLVVISTWLLYPVLRSQAVFIGLMYAGLMWLALFISRETRKHKLGLTPAERLQELAKLFPIFHFFAGFGLFLYIINQQLSG